MPRKLSAPPARLFAGTSGWAYPTWKPGFYPPEVSAKKFLSYYASRLNSVEVNHTFTKLPGVNVVAEWLAQTPANFRLSFKAPQRITHFSRLLDCKPHLEAFGLAIQPVVDARRCGLILFQLPPNFKANPERLSSFLALCRTVEPFAEAQLAFEFRHASWFDPQTYDLLAAHNVAVCIADTDTLTTPEVHTAASHTAFRPRRAGGYKPRELKAMAARLSALAQERDVYAYFRHEDEPTGALNAVSFLAAAAREVKP